MNNLISRSIASDIKIIKENYDVSNPVVAEIIKAKVERFKILQQLNTQDEEDDFLSVNLQTSTPKVKAKETTNEKKYSKKEKLDGFLSPALIRRSERLQKLISDNHKENHEEEVSEKRTIKPPVIRPPNDYGPVAGVEVGHHWETRMECSIYGVHRPTVAGIHGGPNGAYSIALSGGYPEDIDEGDTFIYTGAGGRDLKGTIQKPKNLRTAPQTKDQQLEGTNLSLVKSIDSKLPIRVIRGYKSHSIFAPETGYRYDGLYQVVKYWEDVGTTGHRIYRYRMKRMKNQAPPPWEDHSEPLCIKANAKPGEIIKSTINDKDDFKENLDPFEKCNDEKNYCLKDLKKCEAEIENCIKFFCTIIPTTDCKDINKISVDEDFQGWDNGSL